METLIMARIPRFRFPLLAAVSLLWLVLGFCFCASAQPPLSRDHVLRVWDLEDGLPDNHVGSIARTADGYLWLTTFSGLVRFDGRKFQLMGKAEVPGLPTPWVRPVFVDSNDTLWLGLERGAAARWPRGGRVEQFLPIQPRPTNALWPTSAAEDGSGAVWFGSGHEARLVRWEEGRVSSFGQEEGVPTGGYVRVKSTARGRIWCSSSSGCARFEDGGFIPVESGWNEPRQLAAGAGGGMWIVGEGRIKRYSEDGDLTVDLEVPGLPVRINQVLEDHQGKLWIGDWGSGLWLWNDGELERVPSSFGLISALFEDREGSLWVGTWGGALDRVTERRFMLHADPDRELEPGFKSVALDGSGRFWTVDGLDRLAVGVKAGDPVSLVTPDGWNERIRAKLVLPDGEGGIWIAGSSGLFRWRGDRFEVMGLREPLRAMLTGDPGTLWVARDNGAVFRQTADGWEPLPMNDGLRDVRSMARDDRGHVWFGTMSGLVFRLADGRLERVGLPGAGGDETVRAIIPDGRDVWICSLLGGLYRWREGVVQRCPQGPGLPLAEIRSLTIQTNGGEGDVFWIGTANGLYSTTRLALEQAFDSAEPIRATRHTANDGLPNLDFPEGGGEVTARSPDGKLWFAVNRGLLEVRPRRLPLMAGPRRVLIESATVGDRNLAVSGGGPWKLPPKPGLLRIRYTLPELAFPEQVRFRYRLRDGGSDEWSDVGLDREATFAGLAPGRYGFEVQAAVASGSWLPGSAALEFSVLPHWWQTIGFRIGSAFALAAVIGGAVALASRARIRRLKQKRAVERERARIARDMHDEIGADLTLIGTKIRLAQLDDPAAAATHLDEISDTARKTVDSLDEIVWAVNPRYDSLAGTIEYLGKHAVRFLSSSGLSCELDLPERIPIHPLRADVRHHLLRVVKEALNNAVKHSKGSRVRVGVTLDETGLAVVIEDDGAGFPKKAPVALSSGLINMRERMSAIGGTIDFTEPETGGVRVALRLPLRLDRATFHLKPTTESEP